jgi:hypothetical protein
MCGVDGAFRQEFGCRPSAVVAVLSGLIDMLGSRIKQHGMAEGLMRKKSGLAMIDGYVHGLADREAEKIRADLLPHRDRKWVFNHLWNLSRLCSRH